jgi:H+/Cl- antiporter ClcA
VFAIEEMARGFQHKNSSIVLTAIVLSGAASMSILGNYTYFGVADATFDVARDWWAVVVVGVIGGLGGRFFAWAMVDGVRKIMKWRGGKAQAHPVVFAASCGLLVAVLGFLTDGATFGTGYGIANDLLHGKAAVSWSFAAAKFAATVASNVSGVPGGLFSPSLSVGAALGSSMAPWFPGISAQAIILLGMVAYFAGVTQAPITAFVIVLEITGKGVMPAPLIATAVIAAAVGRLLMPVPLYHRMADSFITRTQQALAAREVTQPPPAPPAAESETPPQQSPA